MENMDEILDQTFNVKVHYLANSKFLAKRQKRRNLKQNGFKDIFRKA